MAGSLRCDECRSCSCSRVEGEALRKVLVGSSESQASVQQQKYVGAAHVTVKLVQAPSSGMLYTRYTRRWDVVKGGCMQVAGG